METRHEQTGKLPAKAAVFRRSLEPAARAMNGLMKRRPKQRAKQSAETDGDGSKEMKSNFQNGDESDMIAAIIAGDTHLYHRLIRPYELTVYRISLCCIKNEKDAEDVTQETFLKAFRKLCCFPKGTSFGVWLIAIALDEAQFRLNRSSAVRLDHPDELQGEDIRALPAPLHKWRELSSEVLERREITASFRQALLSLPDIYQQVLILRDIEALTVYDTAQILNISTSMVRVILNRARMMLQKVLAPQLGPENCHWERSGMQSVNPPEVISRPAQGA
jgi:RNA polymerase sigma-70 factor, ECF subfamily